jgi:hypothetical protein
MNGRFQDEEGIAQVGWHLSAQRLADEVIVSDHSSVGLQLCAWNQAHNEALPISAYQEHQVIFPGYAHWFASQHVKGC